MWKTIVPAAAVLAAEAVIRRKINALPAETFPLRIGQRSRRWRPCAPAAGAARRCRSVWA